jgi:serine/threonine protein phosphatase PrpC
VGIPSFAALPGDLQLAQLSQTGGRERNEDACGHRVAGSLVCVVLADGAGGHQAGDVASRTAVDAVLEAFAEAPRCASDAVGVLLEHANEAVLGAQALARQDMRSTVLLLVCDTSTNQALWAHAGDSRLYVFRDGAVLGRTRDHSFLQTMIEAGYTEPGDARGNAHRNVLTTSLGVRDAFEYEALTSPFLLKRGDVFLLCSDGFWEYVPDAMMESTLRQAPDPGSWLADMESVVVRSGRPGQDNYSAIALWYAMSELPTTILGKPDPSR